MVPQYIYVLWAGGEQAVFTWPNTCKKYLRDVYTVDGKLCLPPKELLILTRFKANPKAGSTIHSQELNVENFLAES